MAIHDEEGGQDRQPVAIVYPYTDLVGRTRYEVHRRPNKRFKQRRPDPTQPGSWLWDLDGVERVPYRWPKLFLTVEAGGEVFVVEGEKDADRLAELNLCATTSAQGASWQWPDTWADHFRGAGQVVVIADNDEPGREAAHQRAHVIRTVCNDVRVIEALPEVGDKGDVSDWLDAGHTADDLWKLVEATPNLPAVELSDVPQHARAVDGATFILSESTTVTAVWGEHDNVLWAEGEPLMIVGPAGVGKTTLGQQVTLALLGKWPDTLGYAVRPAQRRVLYIAADRPRQAARSLRRMVTTDDEDMLRDRLMVWKGPLPFDVVREPERLVMMAQQYEADAVVVDSLKDIAAKLSDDEVGGKVNMALQHCVAAEIDVCALHHQRKQQAGGGKPTALADVYGSTWLTAGAGSVLLVWGEPGDAVVELNHLKQPDADVGPLTLKHDHRAGRTIVDRGFDLVAFLGRRPQGATVAEMAMARFDTTKPKPNQMEKLRRQVNAALERGVICPAGDPRIGGAGGSEGARYGLAARREENEPCPN